MATKTPSKAAPKPKAKKAPTKPAPTRAKPPVAKKDDKVAPRKAAKSEPKPTARAQSPVAHKPTSRQKPQPPIYVPRGFSVLDDEDDVLGIGGAGLGAGYGKCGGRMLGSTLEQSVCDRLGQAGVAHSHSPRHFEVAMVEKQVAAYAPMIVLRGRGREGKSVVIEAADDLKNPILPKIVAFRRQYGQEYYVILIASDEVLEEVPLATYDEACATTDVNTLIARLAE